MPENSQQLLPVLVLSFGYVFAFQYLGSGLLSESVLDQNGPKWSKRPCWSKWPDSELDFSIRETNMDQNGPFWPDEVHTLILRATFPAVLENSGAH